MCVCERSPYLVHGGLRVDEAEGADGDGHVAALHGQLMLQRAEEAIHSKLSGGIGRRERRGHFTWERQQTERERASAEEKRDRDTDRDSYRNID